MFGFHDRQQPYHTQPESLIIDNSAGGWHHLFFGEIQGFFEGGAGTGLGKGRGEQ